MIQNTISGNERRWDVGLDPTAIDKVMDAPDEVWGGATLPAAPSVRSAKSRHFSMEKWTKRRAMILP